MTTIALNIQRTTSARLPMSRPANAKRTERHSAAVYRRRRLVVGSIAALAVISAGLAVSEVLAGDGGATASAAVTGPEFVRQTVTAQPGDTLWAIARRFHGSVDVDRYLDRLISLNGGPSIQAGQAIVLP
jgi:LysM repeat protein